MRTPVSYDGAFPLPWCASPHFECAPRPNNACPLLPSSARISYHARGPSFESSFRCTITAHFSQTCIKVLFLECSNAAVHVTTTCGDGTYARTYRSAALPCNDFIC